MYQSNVTAAVCQHHACDASVDPQTTELGTPGCGLTGGEGGIFLRRKSLLNKKY